MAPRVLLLGGHGKVSLFLTPKIVARSWDLISVIRDPAQKADILEAAKNGPGKVDVLISSLEDVKSEADAKKILDEAKPDWVVWSAGAGGKGGAQRTYAIDRDACVAFIRSSLATPSISKFLIVSAISERRGRAPWWNDDAAYEKVQHLNEKILPDYYKAKLVADEALTVGGEERIKKSSDFSYIIVRPGGLTDSPEGGKVSLGHTAAYGSVPRGDVADITVRLLEAEGANGWYDLLEGEESSEDAVKRVVSNKINSMDGEDIETMKKDLS